MPQWRESLGTACQAPAARPSPTGGTGPMRTRLALWSVASVTLLALSACAQGSSDDNESKSSDFDPDKSYSGTIQAMGFGAGDEIATTRLDIAEKSLGGAKVKLIEGDLDIQAFLT